MPSTFFGLSIGTSGLYTYQAALNVTGHNVSNTNTKGYTRQQLIQEASRAISVSSTYGMSGTGVNATAIIQQRNVYLDAKYRDNACTLGSYKTKEYYMLSIESYFSEVRSDGTTATFDRFNEALNTLATSAADPTYRTQVSSYAQNFTEYVNYLATGLQSIQKECNFEIKNTADRINSIAESIASLTKQINTIEMTGKKANDLRDSRELLLDELSQLANVTSEERVVGEGGVGRTEFTVRLDGQLLVDTYNYNTLNCVTETAAKAQSDANGLYRLEWSNGQVFNATSKSLGGSLQALFEMRDGNNMENLKGSITEVNTGAIPHTVKMKGTTCNDINKLNIPAKDGIVTIDDQDYEYSSFTVNITPTGEYEYTFELKEEINATVTTPASGGIGDSVDYKGIPYYMSKLNEFVRTYASAFNDIHNQGEDLKGNNGVDFFNIKDPVTGKNYNFIEQNLTGFSSIPTGSTGDLLNGSYYNMTALNFGVSESIIKFPETIATSADIDQGVEEISIIEKLIKLKDDRNMFKQGTPDAFLQSFTSEIGIDAKKATLFVENQGNILEAIDNRRMSVSGVDEDEEAMNLVKFKNAYDLSAKFIQVLNEVYDKLINGTGV